MGQVTASRAALLQSCYLSWDLPFFEAFVHYFGKDRQQLISREASQVAQQSSLGTIESTDDEGCSIASSEGSVSHYPCGKLTMRIMGTIGPAGVMEYVFECFR